MPDLADDVGYWGRSGQVAANLLEESENSFGLWSFGPPFGPSDLARCTSSIHDDPLIGGTECPIEARQGEAALRAAIGTFPTWSV
jgi:hypothetical protein